MSSLVKQRMTEVEDCGSPAQKDLHIYNNHEVTGNLCNVRGNYIWEIVAYNIVVFKIGRVE